MKRSFIGTLLVLSGFTQFISLVAGEPIKSPAPPDKTGKLGETRSNAIDGVYLLVELAPKVTSGSQMPIKITLVNDGKEEVAYEFETIDPFMVQLSITQKNGKPAYLTQLGRREIKHESDDDELLLSLDGSTRVFFLSPKKKDDLSVSNLGLYYDLTLPGEYAITISKDVIISDYDGKNKKVVLKTTPIMIKVERPLR